MWRREPRAALRQDLATNPIPLLLQDEKPHHAIVDQDGVPDRNVVDQSIVIYVDGIFLLALGAPNGELEDIARTSIAD